MTNISKEALLTLEKTAVATVSTVLRQKGFTRVSLRGPRALVEGQKRIAGPAYTMRFVPAREDITTTMAVTGPTSPRAVMEKIPAGAVVVVDAMGLRSAGVFGDIICARMQTRGIAGLVTDGAIRDLVGMKKLNWPIWADGTTAPPSPSEFFCADTQVAVACGGVTIFPGDIVVADDDGAVVVPAAIAEAVAVEAFEKDRFEEWVYDQVKAGALLDGLYPPNDATKERYSKERR
ncbi:ribonuclease activity regulator RraA (plasmid) [Bradyrhizobium sp. 62B]|uniref:RraA family protein n=1 Tax=Bradyrhizobium sp. 62B TaxID=2898442 RepID=UPI0025582948|nr:ribonuclease activity regulator RraA [Bradyrhizobium sp. 62B]